MSDDVVDPNDGERNKERMNRTSVSRNATVTDNLDSMFSLLCDSRRRYLLYYLFTVDSNVVELEAAVNAVYTYETAGTETDDQASREAVRVSLHHTLLPRLGDAGVLAMICGRAPCDSRHRLRLKNGLNTRRLRNWTNRRYCGL